MDAAEVEFLAEKEMVTIIPNFSLDKIYLIGVRALAGHLPEAPAGGTGVRERPGLWGLCGRRLVPLCSHVSEGKPGGGFGVPSPRGLRGPGWGEVRSREAWAGGSPGGTRASQVFSRFLPAARRETGPRCAARCAARCGQPHRADVGCLPRLRDPRGLSLYLRCHLHGARSVPGQLRSPVMPCLDLPGLFFPPAGGSGAL